MLGGRARLHSWWQKTKKPLEIVSIIIALILLAVLIMLIVQGYKLNWEWVGVGPYTTPVHPQGTDFQRDKTLWDWLQLLIIPIVLAIGGYIFNLTVSRNERKAAANRDQTERDIAKDNQQEATLQEYINKMSELLLDKKLRESTENDEVQKIARVRTLTVLPRLDERRKKSVLQFLFEAGLIDKDKNNIVNLSGANLSEANLSRADLSRADLSETDLFFADLSEANLSGVNLSGAFLFNSDMSEANLWKANLSEAYLEEANLWKANLSEADLSGAELYNTDMSEADLRGAVLRGAILSVDYDYTTLIKTDEADLSGAVLYNADLSYAKLSSTGLSNADLRRADLRGADLRGSYLHKADLSEANLSEANLSRAYLKGTTGITIEELEKEAKSLEGATMPDGTMHP